MSNLINHLSDARLSLRGIKGIIDADLIKLVDEKKDREKLYRARKPCFLLCDQTCDLFDELELLLCESSGHHNQATDQLTLRLEGFYSDLWSGVTGSVSPIRLMAGSFREVINAPSDEVYDKIIYQDAIDELVEAIGDTTDNLRELKTEMEATLTDYKQDFLGI